ncbi:MAG: hypothetical protein IPJ69_08390 [Deltaproteobacteria bacterium]|nr:MAG: hypothetical protein IPJ69_08390 [Deltaproteobacteria bacterium]
MVKHIRQPPTYPSIHRTPHSRPETPETPSPGGMEPSPPTPHFITPGFSLSLPSISLSPGTTNIAPTNPLFRGAAGMVPIAAPTSPSTTAASLQNRSEVDRLEDQIKNEIHRLTETMEREQARHPDRPFSQHARLAELSQLSIHLSRMKAAGQIRSEGFRTLVERERTITHGGCSSPCSQHR